MPGTGEPPMLMYGYAKNIFWFWFIKPRLESEVPWSANWAMDGNAPPNMLPPPTDGKDISADSMSWVVAACVCRPVNDAFCTSTGNPQDIGVRLALAGPAMTASINRTNKADLFTMLITLL
jgi:hypothetical protein